MSASTRISVQTENFSVGDEYQWLSECDSDGAVVTFTGKVRNHNLGDEVSTLTLEHYPGMTEKALNDIVNEARGRWPLQRVSVIHRVIRRIYTFLYIIHFKQNCICPSS